MSLETVENKYLDGRSYSNCSDNTGALVDEEVKNILKKCYDVACRLICENKEALEKIAAFLYEKETITGKEFMEIFNEVLPDATAYKIEVEI